MSEKETILKIGRTLDAVIANLDDHLKNDHKMENHGYLGKGQDATLRFYLVNCHEQLKEALSLLREVPFNPKEEAKTT